MSEDLPAASTESTKIRQRLDRALNGILLVVAVQFVLGMWVNLFGSFPQADSGALGALLDANDVALSLHVVVGFVMLVGSLFILRLSWRDAWQGIRRFTAVGVVAIVLAIPFGEAFVYTGYSNNGESFAMALAFVAIVTAYYEGLVALRSHPLNEPSRAGAG